MSGAAVVCHVVSACGLGLVGIAAVCPWSVYSSVVGVVGALAVAVGIMAAMEVQR